MSDKKLKLVKEDVVDVAEERIRNMHQQGELEVPENYAVGNALKAAWLELQETKDKNGTPVLKSCTNNSICNALLDMVVKGLNPAKNQVDFIAYGSKLTAQPNRFGIEYLVKAHAGARDVYPRVVYEDDEFEYEVQNGRTVIKKHKQSLQSKQTDPIGGYAVIVFEDERPDYAEVMTIQQIKNAWEQGPTYNGESSSTPHNNFSEEMIKKTVSKRTCKAYINGSDDKNMVKAKGAINGGDIARTEQEVEEEIEENANQEVIDVEPEPVDEDEQEKDQEQDSQPEEPEQQQLDATGTEGPGF